MQRHRYPLAADLKAAFTLGMSVVAAQIAYTAGKIVVHLNCGQVYGPPRAASAIESKELTRHDSDTGSQLRAAARRRRRPWGPSAIVPLRARTYTHTRASVTCVYVSLLLSLVGINRLGNYVISR